MLDIARRKHFGGMTAGDREIWDVTNNTTTGLNNCALPNSYAPKHYHSAPQPNIVGNLNIFRNVCFVVRNLPAFVVIVILSNEQALATRVKIIADHYPSSTGNNQPIEIDVIPKKRIAGNFCPEVRNHFSFVTPTPAPYFARPICATQSSDKSTYEANNEVQEAPSQMRRSEAANASPLSLKINNPTSGKIIYGNARTNFFMSPYISFFTAIA